MSELKIVTFQTHQDEYTVLGMETKTPNGTVGDWGARWGVYFENGFNDKVEPYKNDNSLLGLFCQSEPGYYNYLIGAMVKEVGQAPEGMFIQKFPESEYLVVTHEWVDTPQEADGQIGRMVGAAHDGSVPIPDGYEKYTDPVMFIERYNYNENGKSRFEVWLAIRKVQKKLEKFEIVKNEPYKFVGKSVYLGNKRGSAELFKSIWEKSDWVFAELDKMEEYATDEIHNAVLFTWEKYDDKNELFGYYVGRFMKPDTPITKDIDFDYFDITEGHIAKTWTKGKFGDKFGSMLVYGEQCTNDEIAKSGYKAQGWIWMAEIYTKPDKNGDTFVGTYMKCDK